MIIDNKLPLDSLFKILHFEKILFLKQLISVVSIVCHQNVTVLFAKTQDPLCHSFPLLVSTNSKQNVLKSISIRIIL